MIGLRLMISANRSFRQTRAGYEFFAHLHSICGRVIIVAIIFVSPKWQYQKKDALPMLLVLT